MRAQVRVRGRAFDILMDVLEQGAEVDAADVCGRTALHLAARSGSVVTVSALLEAAIAACAARLEELRAETRDIFKGMRFV